MRSFGYELEWANVDKAKTIPEKYGCWEGKGQHSEVDIINEIDGEFTPAWPNKRWGAEINVAPATTPERGADYVLELWNLLYRSDAGVARVTPISNGHVHVADDAFEELEYLKKLYAFTIRNQDAIIKYWLSLDELPEIKKKRAHHASAYRYLRNDGGKRLSANWTDPVAAATTVDEFQRALVPHSKTTGAILWARAGRPGINLHSLRHTGTIEFRCMKATCKPEEVYGQLLFARDFVDRVINDSPDYTEADLYDFAKPPLDPDNLFDDERWKIGVNAWWDTREERKLTGTKVRLGRMDVVGVDIEPVGLFDADNDNETAP